MHFEWSNQQYFCLKTWCEIEIVSNLSNYCNLIRQIKSQLSNKLHKVVFSLEHLYFCNQAALKHSCKCWQLVNVKHFNPLKYKFLVSSTQIPKLEVWDMMLHIIKTGFFVQLWNGSKHPKNEWLSNFFHDNLCKRNFFSINSHQNQVIHLKLWD